MPTAQGGIQLDGFKELIRDMKGGEERLDLEVRKRMRTLVKDIESDAKSAGSAFGAPGHVIRSIRASVSASSAAIKLGNESSAPDALGWEFGAARGQQRFRASGSYLGFNQFPPWTGNAGDAGNFLWPTIREHRDTLYDDLLDIIEEIVEGTDHAA